jgi:hypothetical protein
MPGRREHILYIYTVNIRSCFDCIEYFSAHMYHLLRILPKLVIVPGFDSITKLDSQETLIHIQYVGISRACKIRGGNIPKNMLVICPGDDNTF